MTRAAEVESAYFTLLRAQEERDGLLRYREYLEAEQRRLDAFSAGTRDGAEAVPARLRRTLDGTTKPVLEAVGRRRAVLLGELARMDDRDTAAAAFVAECEADLAALRAGTG